MGNRGTYRLFETTGSSHRLAFASPVQTNFSRFLDSHRRSGLELTGAFICISVLAVLGAGLRNNVLSFASSDPSTKHSAALNVDVNNSAASVDNSGQSAADGKAGITTNISSDTDSDGLVNAEMTVNGQSISIPSNGSSQQTVTSADGQTTTVTTTSQQSTVGTAGNANRSHTRLTIHSSTHSSNITEESQTP